MQPNNSENVILSHLLVSDLQSSHQAGAWFKFVHSHAASL